MDIKTARTALGLTQREVCEITGVPKRTIENWDAGVRKPPEYVERLVVNELMLYAEEKKLKMKVDSSS